MANTPPNTVIDALTQDKMVVINGTRKLIADGLDPGQARHAEKQEANLAAMQTFELLARMWMEKTAAGRAESTCQKVIDWLERDVFPYIGQVPLSKLKPRDVLVCLQHMEAPGVNKSAHRVKQICGQVLRFAVETGLTERDVTADLKGALTVPVLDEIMEERVDLIEHQLAHAVRAYIRATHLAGRRTMMQRWADYLDELRGIARPSR